MNKSTLLDQSVLLAIISEINNLGIPAIWGHKYCHRWKPEGKERNLARWLNRETTPTPEAATTFADEVWNHIHAGNSDPAYRDRVTTIISRVDPGAPCATWLRIDFGAWFRNLATK